MSVGMLGFFDIDERLKELSAKGDDLERIKSLVDLEIFRRDLEAAVPRADRSKGGRRPSRSRPRQPRLQHAAIGLAEGQKRCGIG